VWTKAYRAAATRVNTNPSRPQIVQHSGCTRMRTTTMLDVTTTKPDWGQIRSDYEAGIIPVRQIAAREGVSDTAIHKRARSEGWNGSLRKPDEPVLPGLQTTVQTTVQTSPAEVDPIVAAVQRAYATAAHPKDEFEWDPENLDILITETKALAIYMNAWGKIVLRQDGGGSDDDSFVYINVNDVPLLISALKELAETGRREIDHHGRA
jgi:hypothetical protein